LEDREKILDICAAHDVWADHSQALKMRAVLSLTSGETSHLEQHRQASEVLKLQHLEAYARARMTATIAAATDGTADMATQFDEHWANLWGQQLWLTISESWREAFAKSRSALVQRLEEAKAMAAALRDAGA